MEPFVVALEAVGTAAALACAGVVLHRRRMITSENEIALSRFSQQVAIPSLIFTRMVQCQGAKGGENDCSENLLRRLADTPETTILSWLLFVWPIFVVGTGLMIGWFLCRILNVSDSERRVIMAATAFANSTGLPLTILGVLDDSLRRIVPNLTDPTIALTAYMVVYPILLWGVGGWMLSMDDQRDDKNKDKNKIIADNLSSVPYKSLKTFQQDIDEEATLVDNHSGSLSEDFDDKDDDISSTDECESKSKGEIETNFFKRWLELAQAFYSKAFQPPVIAALVGMLVSSISPLRGLLVQLHEDETAPFQWLFRAISTLGQAAIPVNMAVLGFNLSTSASTGRVGTRRSTILAVVCGKMILVPSVGIFTVVALKYFLSALSDSVQASSTSVQISLYLVMMIVFITPTANTMMIMVEVSTSDRQAKEDIANVIAWQYALSPFLLSLSIAAIQQVAIMKF